MWIYYTSDFKGYLFRERGGMTLWCRCFIVITLGFFCLNGCQIGGPKQAKGLPAWVTSPPQDSAEFYYGIGSGLSLAASKRSAFNDISQKLYTSISSKISSGQTKSMGKTSSSYQERVQSETAKLNFKGAQIVESVNAGIQFYSLISVPRSNVLEDIDLRRNDALTLLAKAINNKGSKIDRFILFNRVAPNADTAKMLALIQGGIDPGFSSANTLSTISTFHAQRQRNANSIRVRIKGPDGAKPIKQNIQRFFSDLLLKGAGDDASLIVELDYTVSSSEIYGTKSSLVALGILIVDAGGEVRFDKTIKQAGSSVNGYNNATENALNKLANIVLESGIKESLGLE